jgi:sporulation protein YlmC with PRC-barrel domain
MRIELDTKASTSDGGLAEILDVVIDPRTRRLTHLVITTDRPDDARLLPIAVASGDDHSADVALRITSTEIAQAEAINESGYMRLGEMPVVAEDWDIGIHELYPRPAYGGLGSEILGAGTAMEYDDHVVVSYHRVPKAHVEIRRESSVTSSDGHHLGHVVGFAIDDQARISSLILEHGHLWGKRSVAVPEHAIDRFENDEVTLNISADDVGALKPI